jgi:hypothetical protein
MQTSPTIETPITVENYPRNSTPNSLNLESGSLQGREIVNIPTSFTDKPSKEQSIGGTICCCIALASTIAGGVMWGICNDVTTQGCNVAIREAGKALVGVGVGIIGLEVCCVTAIVCCGVGLGVLAGLQK